MNNKIILLALFIALAGCAANDYVVMSKATGISQIMLTNSCEQISCDYDKLQDRVEVVANDRNLLSYWNGEESRTIEFTWISDSKYISIDLYRTTLYGDWSFFESAEVYIDKEMVVEISGKVKRIVGVYNIYSESHEKIEIISDVINIKVAQKIAEANYESVTIRFYGEDGYVDRVLPRKHNLVNLVNLVNLAQSL